MLNGKVVETYHFTSAKELRDWLNLWNDKQLSTIWTEDSNGNEITIQWIENDLEDGSHTYDLRFI